MFLKINIQSNQISFIFNDLSLFMYEGSWHWFSQKKYIYLLISESFHIFFLIQHQGINNRILISYWIISIFFNILTLKILLSFNSINHRHHDRLHCCRFFFLWNKWKKISQHYKLIILVGMDSKIYLNWKNFTEVKKINFDKDNSRC